MGSSQVPWSQRVGVMVAVAGDAGLAPPHSNECAYDGKAAHRQALRRRVGHNGLLALAEGQHMIS